jgi:hypothetical protein
MNKRSKLKGANVPSPFGGSQVEWILAPIAKMAMEKLIFASRDATSSRSHLQIDAAAHDFLQKSAELTSEDRSRSPNGDQNFVLWIIT